MFLISRVISQGDSISSIAAPMLARLLSVLATLFALSSGQQQFQQVRRTGYDVREYSIISVTTFSNNTMRKGSVR